MKQFYFRSIFIFLDLFLFVFSTSYCQSKATLHLEGNKLVGDCDNKFYAGFEIELDSIYKSIDSLQLFDQFPRVGKINFKNKAFIPTEYTLTERSGTAQIMFRFRTNYFTFDDLVVEDQMIRFTIDHDPVVPFVEDDLRIIQIAKSMLSEEASWNKVDDRNCEDDLANGTYSLYCALRLASLEVENRYNHRNAVLQKLRHLIERKYEGRVWEHRFLEYNNMEETSYEDIVNILDEIEEAINKELEQP